MRIIKSYTEYGIFRVTAEEDELEMVDPLLYASRPKAVKRARELESRGIAGPRLVVSPVEVSWRRVL